MRERVEALGGTISFRIQKGLRYIFLCRRREKYRDEVVIVDDDQLVALSLKTILEANEEISVVGTGNDGTEAVALYEREKPDILLMDIQMKPMSGLEAAEQILEKDREAKILFLTTFSDDEYIVKALDLGAKGYILKQDFEGLVPALQATARHAAPCAMLAADASGSQWVTPYLESCPRSIIVYI